MDSEGPKPGFNRKCLHLTDTARGFMHALTANQYGHSTANNLGERAALEGIDAAFPFDALATVRDEKGEFLVTVVGEGEEKNFKIKTKHLDDLGIK
jgi:hypothetical protein